MKTIHPDTWKQDLPAFREKTAAFYAGELDKAAYKGFSGLYGSYAQKGGQANMLRLRMTAGRVIIGPGTLYSLLESFQQEGYIQETRVEGRKRSYQITVKGRLRLEEEVRRLRRQIEDFEHFGGRERP